MKPLEGKVALVTGGSRGIGEAIVKRLADEGAYAAFTYVPNAGSPEQVIADIASFGGKASGYLCDSTNADDVERTINAVVEKCGGLDILVNNAGITRDGLIARMSDSDWDAVLNVNLKGAFIVSRAAIRYMMGKRQGRIINIASVVGITGNPGQANYVSSKAGVIGLTKAIAKELAGRNITANAVAPGFIATPMTEQLNEFQRAAISAQIPLKRQGTPEEVAGVVAFLAGPDAAYMTGQSGVSTAAW